MEIDTSISMSKGKSEQTFKGFFFKTSGSSNTDISSVK